MKYFVLLVSIVAITAFDLQGTAVDQCLCRDELTQIYNQLVDANVELKEAIDEMIQLESDMEYMDNRVEAQNENLEELESALTMLRYIQLQTLQELSSQDQILNCIVVTVQNIDVQVKNETTHVNQQTIDIGALQQLTNEIQQCNNVNSCVAPTTTPAPTTTTVPTITTEDLSNI
ncbi:uncharacterized protein LOC114327073 isoform X4 [Diabrotica virgifera virgifera]|uniref:t-SNARE coiled-coil homology domain-containing protein n=1 Tax=Diabrotica virgifera virgifera TaxID=50390 RepID=A0ABM5IF27_DIAVI|nr:uncharacterized protein LOC114327073 isoform X4 [Diabrotica virgifera virgifera]